MNWATNFLRAKCATTGTRCKTVVILSMRHCFTGKNGELELRNYKGRAFPFFAQNFVGYSDPSHRLETKRQRVADARQLVRA